jgi:multiple sugar transport system permease protein
MIYPLAFAFLGSFLSLEEFYGVTFLPIPTHLGSFFKNIAVLFKRSEFINSIGITMLRVLWYSFIVGATSVFGGYVFAKVNFKGKKIAFYVLMSSMMVPGVALLIPQYMMLARFPLVGGNDIFGKGGFGFINNASVLFVTGCFSAYNIFLLRQGFSSLADDFKEAAEVDGASFFTVVFRIYLPMVKPMLAVIFISLFIGQWNDYFFPFIFVSGNPAALPVGVASVRISDDYLYASGISGAGLVNYPVVMACAVVMMLPPMAVFITFQRYFIAGMTLGGVKS